MTTSNDSTEPGYVPAAVVANILNLSVQELSRLVKAQLIPPPLGETYHLLRTVQVYIAYLQGQANDPSKAIKAELAREQLRARRLANDREERVALPVEEVSTLLVGALDAVREGLLDQSRVIAETFPELAHEIVDAIDDHNRALLERLARTPLPAPLPTGLGELARTTATGPARKDN